MRRPRLTAPKSHPFAWYHCVSRVVNREQVLGREEKEKFVTLMRCYERLYGLRVASYCIMSNHFHILVEVPRRPDDADLPSNPELVSLVRSCLGDTQADELEWQLEHFLKMGDVGTGPAAALRERWFGRMWNVSTFMKILKQRFSQWFNGKHRRCGTLWEDRFRSVLVEGGGPALRAMAAYIDLNPVRAGICEDPKDYRWCSYAEAVAHAGPARDAVTWLASMAADGTMASAKTRDQPPRIGKIGTDVEAVAAHEAAAPVAVPAEEALRKWRCHLFGVPETGSGQAGGVDAAALWRSRIPREKALEVLAAGGRLGTAEYLRCKVRYFTDGAVLGSRNFVEDIFQRTRDQFGPKRQTGARPLRGLESAEGEPPLYNLRHLQKRVFT